jgi:hypothetical protein
MKRGESLRSRALCAGLLLCLAALTTGCTADGVDSMAARTGRWEGETAFGSFSFTVCASGKRITGYMLEYTTAGSTQALGGDVEVLLGEDGAFDLSEPEAGVVFTGQLSADGTSASGVWEVTTPNGETVSEGWSVKR